jgi:type II secretory pathway component GspD/PulD (secretin)
MAAAAGLAAGLSGLAVPVGAQAIAQPEPAAKGTTTTTRQVAPVRRPGRTDQPGVQPGVQPLAQPGTNPQLGGAANPGNAGGAADEPAAVEVPKITTEDGFVEFSRFAEPVELSLLVEIVAETLQLNIFQDPGLSGSIVFNAPVRVKQDRLLTLLKAWLELYGYSLTFDEATEFYMVMPVSKSPYGLDQRLATTRVYPTPGIRPSALKPSIDALLGGATGTVVGGNRAGRAAQPGQPGMPEGTPMPDGSIQAMPQPTGGGGTGGGGSGGGKVTYNDELGVIIAVDTERRLDQIGAIIDQLTKRYAQYKITSITLEFISPSSAKQRILEALGQAPQQTNRSNRPFDEFGNPVQQQPQQQQTRTTMDNLAERLTVSPIGNQLFFRGLEDERKIIEDLVKLIDSQSSLSPKTYRVGASAKAIADLAKQRGMGEVTTIAAPQDQQNRFGNFGFFYDDSMNRRNQQQPTNGGPVMVVDEGRGQIIYYATTALHGEMARLIDEIKPDDDSVVMREYPLTYAKAEDVESILMGLIREQTPSDNSNSNFLPSGGGGGRGGQPAIVFNAPNPFGGEVSISGKNSFVIADKPNNQVIVKAPLKEQNQFKELIARLDRRRPQVYVEAQIVAVTGSDTFKLAFETQLINARGSGGVVNTNFGLGQFATGGAITDRKQVRTGLAGATAALIKNDQIPIIINALQTVTDTRVLSRPQLLVDANTEEASVEANSAQPTATRTLSDNSTSDAIGFSGYETAGTKLTIKEPRIGPGDSVQMQIDVELSNFSGESPSPELPPPKNENFIKSQVQVPANMTVVVGGVVVDTKRKTTDKIPLLGDIPLLGALFSSFNNVDDKTTLYVFITPRVLRDERLGDPKLLSAGPMREAGLEDRLPPMTPVMVDFVEIHERKPAARPAETPADKPAEKPAGETPAQPVHQPEGNR